MTVVLDRATGDITVEDEFSTPLETWAMLDRAARIKDDALSEPS